MPCGARVARVDVEGVDVEGVDSVAGITRVRRSLLVLRPGTASVPIVGAAASRIVAATRLVFGETSGLAVSVGRSVDIVAERGVGNGADGVWAGAGTDERRARTKSVCSEDRDAGASAGTIRPPSLEFP